MRNKLTTPMAAAIAAALFAAPAVAQKSKDTLRIATKEVWSAFTYYHDPSSEIMPFMENFYNRLLRFDERASKFLPELAKSWKRINATTIEFDLRQDIKFHSGNPFTADDVKYTIDWLKHPKVRLRFKGRYKWVKEVQKLGPYKLRIVAKKPFAMDIFTIAYRFDIFDGKVHGTFKDKREYARVSPSGTGPYRFVSIDKNKGLRLERWEPNVGKFPHRKAPIKYIQTRPIPDSEAQLAQLLTGGVDAMSNITFDIKRGLKNHPNIRMHAVQTKQIIYLWLDAAGRSPNKIFTDKRVRVAFFKAIPRRALMKQIVPGAEIAEEPNSFCFKSTVGCDPSVGVIDYDPEGARKLLAEAGYPNGIDVTMAASEIIKDVIQAIAGEVRKVGIRLKLEIAPRAITTKRRARGELTAYGASYPTGSFPVVTNLLNFFFGGTRDYARDPVILKAKKLGMTEFDTAKRTAIYRPALNRVNSEAYLYGFGEQIFVWAFSKDLRIAKGPTTDSLILIGDWHWK